MVTEKRQKITRNLCSYRLLEESIKSKPSIIMLFEHSVSEVNDNINIIKRYISFL